MNRAPTESSGGAGGGGGGGRGGTFVGRTDNAQRGAAARMAQADERPASVTRSVSLRGGPAGKYAAPSASAAAGRTDSGKAMLARSASTSRAGGMLPRGWGAHYLNCLTTTTRSAAVAPPPPPPLSGDGPPGTAAAERPEAAAATHRRRLALSDGGFAAALCRRTLALDRAYYRHPANLGMCVACL